MGKELIQLSNKITGRGGWRPNAGRPRGGTLAKLTIKDHFTKKEVRELVAKAKELARGGDKTILMFLMEHIHGKATQQTQVTGVGGGDLVIHQVLYNGSKNTPQVRTKSIPATPINGATGG